MRLAEVLEEALGGSSAVGFRAYDGSVAGPADPVGVVEIRSPMALRYVVGSPGDLGLARAYVTGALEVHGDLYADLGRAGEGARRQPPARPEARRPQGCGRTCRPAPTAAAARGARRGAGSAGPPALQAPRRRRDQPPLRRLEPLLLVAARPVDGLHVRLLPDAGRDAGRGAGREVRPRRPQAAPRAGHAAARRRVRLGRHGAARGSRVRRPGARRDPVAQAGRVGRARPSRTPGSPTWPRSGTRTTATSPSPASTRSPRSG